MKRDTVMLKLYKLPERYSVTEMTVNFHVLFCAQEAFSTLQATNGFLI